MAPKDCFVAETTFHVRYAETDTMGIVHHSSYVVYFEEGRSAYARQRGQPYSSLERDGYFLTVTEMNARYLRPAVYEQRITVRTWLTEMQSRAVSFQYEIVDAETDDVLVTGETRHVCITREGRVARIPERWRSWMTG